MLQKMQETEPKRIWSTIPEERKEKIPQKTDKINRHIFPGVSLDFVQAPGVTKLFVL